MNSHAGFKTASSSLTSKNLEIIRSVASEPGERIGVNHTSLQLKLSAVRKIDAYNHPKLCQLDVEIAAGIVEAEVTSLSYS